MPDMQLFTYTASTYKEAMELAKSNHGEDALVVTSREIKKKSFLENGLYEIVVVAPRVDTKEKEKEEENAKSLESKEAKNSIQKRLEEINSKALNKNKENKLSDVDLHLSNTVKEIAFLAKNGRERDAYIDSNEGKIEIREETKKEKEKLLNLTKEELKELKTIKQEIEKLNDKMKVVQSMIWNEASTKTQSDIPYEFAEIYRICKNSGMHGEHLEEIMNLSKNHMPLNMRENSETIRRYFREILRKMIICRPENIDMKRKRIIMLVGPTGVGKTTTIAKLAAHYTLYHKYKVGLITLDSYRIGAFDQLAFYAKKLKLSMNIVEDTLEFTKSLEELKYCDYILIDTLGSSQHDEQKLDILKKYVSADYNIDVNLVLCANTKYEDLKDTYEAFNILNIDTLIFSKLDESNGFGNVFSLIYATKKPVSYLSIGQEVPDDILVAKNDYLADCIINGFTKVKKDEI